MRGEYFLDDDTTIFVGFGPDRDKLDLTDARQVQEAVRHWLLDVEVIESTGHDWGADPCTRQTWSTPRVRQFLRTWDYEFGHRDHRLAFASGDLVEGWNGFVDGAIESGLTAARGVHRWAHQGASVGEPDHQGMETSMVARLN